MLCIERGKKATSVLLSREPQKMWLEIEKLEQKMLCFKYDLQETCVNDAQIMKKAPVQRPSRKKGYLHSRCWYLLRQLEQPAT